jgi:[ribosomal protein S18]-alanine N-acetyltransferase
MIADSPQVLSVPLLYLDAADEKDLAAVLAIERQSFTHPWTPGNFRQALAASQHGRVVVLRAPWEDVEGGVLAYCVFEVVADEMHVHNLAVHPRHRGAGLGRRLLRLGLELGYRRGARRALLEVRPSNGPALRLYRSMGFRQVAVRRNYYAHPTEDALVLEKPDL